MNDTWISQTGGDWSDPDNWQGGVVPGAGDSVTITSTVAETITISTAVSVQSLVIDDPAATVDLLDTGTIVATGNIEIDVGSAMLDGPIATGSSLDITTAGSLAVMGSISALMITIKVGSILTMPEPIAVASTGIEIDGSVISPGRITVVNDSPVSCFAAGTRIATPDGPRIVQQLAVGDVVTLAGGNTAPIIWIGQRRIDCRRHPAPERVWPVRIEVDAFGMGRPHAPLFLSPDHAVFVDDVLVPVKRLVNGTTIRQMPVADVTYFHLELARHDVVLAEGLPVETYLDTGARAAFGEGVIALHPDFGAPADLALAWEQKGYAPLISDIAVLDRIRIRLAVQASLLDSEMTRERLTKTS